MSESSQGKSNPQLLFYVRISSRYGKRDDPVLKRIRTQFEVEGPHKLELSLEIESIVFSYNNQKWGEFVDRNLQEHVGTLLAAFGRYRLRGPVVPCDTKEPSVEGYLALPKRHRAFKECSSDKLKMMSPEVPQSERIELLAYKFKDGVFSKEDSSTVDNEQTSCQVLANLFGTSDGKAFVNTIIKPSDIHFHDAWTRKSIADEDLAFLLSANRKPMRNLRNHVRLRNKPSESSGKLVRAFGEDHFFINVNVSYDDVMPLCHNHVRVGLATSDSSLQKLIQKYNTHYCEVIEADFGSRNQQSRNLVDELKRECRAHGGDEKLIDVCEKTQGLLNQLCRVECRLSPRKPIESSKALPLKLSRLRLIEPKENPDEPTEKDDDEWVELILMLDFLIGSDEELNGLQDQQVHFAFEYEGPVAKNAGTFPFVTTCPTVGLDFDFQWEEECELSHVSAIPVILDYKGLQFYSTDDRRVGYLSDELDENKKQIEHSGETRLQVNWELPESVKKKEVK